MEAWSGTARQATPTLAQRRRAGEAAGSGRMGNVVAALWIIHPGDEQVCLCERRFRRADGHQNLKRAQQVFGDIKTAVGHGLLERGKNSPFQTGGSLARPVPHYVHSLLGAAVAALRARWRASHGTATHCRSGERPVPMTGTTGMKSE